MEATVRFTDVFISATNAQNLVYNFAKIRNFVFVQKKIRNLLGVVDNDEIYRFFEIATNLLNACFN